MDMGIVDIIHLPCSSDPTAISTTPVLTTLNTHN